MEIECRHPAHNSLPIISVCSHPLCTQSRLCCMTCLLDSHKAHIDSMLKISEIIKFTPINPIINWPKDPTIRYLAIFFQEASKAWGSGKSSENIMDPFAIIDELLSDFFKGNEDTCIQEMHTTLTPWRNKIRNKNVTREYISSKN